MDRKAEFIAVFTKDGYQRQEIPVSTRLASSGAAGFAGNVLLGGVIGMGVDASTGSTLEHYPNPVFATMQPAQAIAPVKPEAKPRKHIAPKPAAPVS
jgi:hypothetical protein